MNRINKNIKFLIAIRCYNGCHDNGCYNGWYNGCLFTVFDFRQYRRQVLNATTVCKIDNIITYDNNEMAQIKYWYIPSKRRHLYLFVSLGSGYVSINGTLHREDYSKDGKNKPAVIVLSGINKKSHSYYINGLRHNIDGPAEILYKNGVICNSYWYENGSMCLIMKKYQ